MVNKVIVIGNGFIASHLSYEIARYYLMPNQDDITNFLRRYNPNILINCTGFCGGSNIDGCEINKNKTYTANTLIPILLAEQCEERNIHLITIGSGCCYYESSPHTDHLWRETDDANAKSYYSKTKYATDLILGDLKHCTTLRIRMPVSEKNSPRNLINKLKSYQQIIDIPNSMTFTFDLMKCIDWAITNRPSGIFHCTNPQPLTAARVMQEYQKHVPSHQFEIITGEQLDQITVAKRSNCLLNTDKLTSAGFTMTNSEEALTNCMVKYVANLNT